MAFDWFDAFVRFLHIASGVTMVGGVFLWGSLIMPDLEKRLPPPARGAFLRAYFPRVSWYLTLSGVVAIVTGAWLMGLIVGFDGILPVVGSTAYGRVLAAGLVVTVAMLAIGTRVIQPAGYALLAIPDPAAEPARVAALQKRLAVAGITNFALSVIVLALMASAVMLRGA